MTLNFNLGPWSNKFKALFYSAISEIVDVDLGPEGGRGRKTIGGKLIRTFDLQKTRLWPDRESKQHLRPYITLVPKNPKRTSTSIG